LEDNIRTNITLIQAHHIIWHSATLSLMIYFAWRQAEDRWPLFHCTLSWGPYFLIQSFSVHVKFVLVVFEETPDSIFCRFSDRSSHPNSTGLFVVGQGFCSFTRAEEQW